MAYLGASGNTRAQMIKVLHIDVDSNYLKSLKHLKSTFVNKKDSANKLAMANSLWIQKEFKIYAKFHEDTKSIFNNAFHTVDFMHHKNQSIEKINSWVEKKTQNKIKTFLHHEDIDSLTRMILINVIYFKGEWKYPFDGKKLKNRAFLLSNKSSIKISMFTKQGNYNYYEDKKYQVVEIPYKNNDYAMVVFLPKKRDIEAPYRGNLNKQILDNAIDNFELKRVAITMPSFEMKKRYDLGKSLINMGMSEPFSSSADFSKMTGDKSLYISKVIQQSFIKNSAKGTEATVATSVIMSRKMITVDKRLRYRTFKMNRPFIFLIRDTKNKKILFIGRVVNPTKS